MQEQRQRQRVSQVRPQVGYPIAGWHKCPIPWAASQVSLNVRVDPPSESLLRPTAPESSTVLPRPRQITHQSLLLFWVCRSEGSKQLGAGKIPHELQHKLTTLARTGEMHGEHAPDAAANRSGGLEAEVVVLGQERWGQRGESIW